MPWGYCRKRSEKHGTQFHATKLRLFLNIVYFFPDIFENNPFHRLLSYFFSPIPCIRPLESRCPFLPKEEMFGLAAIHSPSDFACILTFFILHTHLLYFVFNEYSTDIKMSTRILINPTPLVPPLTFVKSIRHINP